MGECQGHEYFCNPLYANDYLTDYVEDWLCVSFSKKKKKDSRIEPFDLDATCRQAVFCGQLHELIFCMVLGFKQEILYGHLILFPILYCDIDCYFFTKQLTGDLSLSLP